ncbi:hypothetical protein ElyMa_005778300 [Elysia marginata]|uniref:Uncharacterized protein n=1 Tax=Elysia marginata TaxID=1093978 RepID=A0AAV4FRA8_9GAST|nr:hypothetical protein ElyMa_005778300 [Elysia marginata]
MRLRVNQGASLDSHARPRSSDLEEDQTGRFCISPHQELLKLWPPLQWQLAAHVGWIIEKVIAPDYSSFKNLSRRKISFYIPCCFQ